MRFNFKLSLVLAIALSLISSSAFAATRYVRCASLGSSQDGGTGYDATHNPGGQCNGTADVAYDGSGTNENCAWNSPMWALSWKDGAYLQKISGGDTLIITGECQVGYSADGNSFASTSSSYPWDAYMKAVPSGPNSSTKTKIYGSNYATCSGKSDTAKLVGKERVESVLNLEGTDNFEVQCLTITDGLACAEHHPNTSLACQRDSYPYGNWAKNGISILDSENGYLKYVYVDGLASRGVFEGRVQDLLWEYGSISGNPYVGWEGDRGDPDNWANGGTITIKGKPDEKFRITWNGCVHSNPETGNPTDSSCFTQGQSGGYGDGWASSDITGSLGGANYVFENVDMSKNTSDGLDNLYIPNGKNTTITRSNFANNTGNQIKTASTTVVNDTKALGDCAFFEGKSYTYTGSGGFTHCRAAGNTISWGVKGNGNTFDGYGMTVTGQGDVLVISGGANGACNGTERFRFRNSIFQGDTQYGGGDTTDDYYASGATGNGDGSCGTLAIDWSTSGAGNIIYATKNNDTGAGISNSNPLLTNKYTDVSIASGSPARGLRNNSFGNSTDYNGFARTNSSGSLEYGSTASSPSCANTCSLCGDSSACSGSAATCYWWSTNTCNATAEGPICANTCSQCLNQTNCQASAATCYWWSNSTCNSSQEQNSCANTCSTCSGQSACQASAAGCFWWDDSTCHNSPQGSVTTFSVTGKCSISGRRK